MMRTDIKIEKEILLWALDGDTVNNLVKHIKREMLINESETISVVQKLACNNFLNIYVESLNEKRNRSVEFSELTFDLLAVEPYVTLTKTGLTLSRLSEICRADDFT